METLQGPSRGLLAALTALFSPKFLLSKDTRPRVLQWIATALQCDKERTKMHVTDAKATSDGFILNLDRVLLHLCGPFTDFYSGKARQFINLEYDSPLPSCAVPRVLLSSVVHCISASSACTHHLCSSNVRVLR